MTPDQPETSCEQLGALSRAVDALSFHSEFVAFELLVNETRNLALGRLWCCEHCRDYVRAWIAQLYADVHEGADEERAITAKAEPR